MARHFRDESEKENLELALIEQPPAPTAPGSASAPAASRSAAVWGTAKSAASAISSASAELS
jgi:hypothetical protein